MSDRSCKYCGAEIRWCRDEAGHWLPLDVAKLPADAPRAEYVVLGADDARRIAKANRERFGSLYRRHECEQGRNARALVRRERSDLAQRKLAVRQLEHERQALPANVELLRNWRKR
jgi:hypothetical protein